MLDFLVRLDQDITLAVNSLHFSYGDYFWQFVTDKNSWFPFYAIVAVFLFRRLGWKKALIAIACLGLTILACDQCANLFKYSVGRLRPCYNHYMIQNGLHVLEGRGSYYGFFSAHAANAFGFAMCSTKALGMDMSYKTRNYGYLVLVWAFFVAISRVFAGKHFVGDVLVGMLVGLILGYIIGCIAHYVASRVLES